MWGSYDRKTEERILKVLQVLDSQGKAILEGQQDIKELREKGIEQDKKIIMVEEAIILQNERDKVERMLAADKLKTHVKEEFATKSELTSLRQSISHELDYKQKVFLAWVAGATFIIGIVVWFLEKGFIHA